MNETIYAPAVEATSTNPQMIMFLHNSKSCLLLILKSQQSIFGLIIALWILMATLLPHFSR